MSDAPDFHASLLSAIEALIVLNPPEGSAELTLLRALGDACHRYEEAVLPFPWESR